ncbi:MAG: MBL fold metallo-hydrolase [Bacteroidales bacterium]|nr:MBL fold metallo-hydrolase [Bacteroidales bacterium]
MKTVKFLFLGLIFLLPGLQGCGQKYKYLEGREDLAGVNAENGMEDSITIRVIYDNYLKDRKLEADWGYSILIEGLEQEILFDTGTKPEIFENNFKKMGIDAGKIDMLVISHEHYDHIGGIPAFVKMKTGIPVLIPYAFSEKFKKDMTAYSLQPVLVREPAKICEHLYTSGVFDFEIAEQALVINTKKGLVVMTGCSHPGIIEILKKIRSDFRKDIYMVFGGFHLMQKSDSEMEALISEMRAIGVLKCGATHCTGDRQIEMFRNYFGENYVEMGVGNIVSIY